MLIRQIVRHGPDTHQQENIWYAGKRMMCIFLKLIALFLWMIGLYILYNISWNVSFLTEEIVISLLLSSRHIDELVI